MAECGCHAEASNEAERRILRLALALNASMFVIGALAGWLAQSMA
jgi:Co/Zn/Cd efflux system component